MVASLPLAAAAAIPLWLSTPFVLLLVLIAVMPLTGPRLKHVWERYYPHVAIGLLGRSPTRTSGST